MKVQAALEAAVGHHQAGRLAEAEALYRQVLSVVPNHPAALHFMGMLAGQVGKRETGIDLVRRALAAAPGYAEAHNTLGTLLKDCGRPDEAADHYRRAAAIRGDFAEAHTNLGNVLKELGRLEEAVSSHRRALAARPGFALAEVNLGVTLTAMGRHDEAVACHRRAIALAPAFAEAHNCLGAALQAAGRTAEAADAYRRAAEVRPDYAEALYNRGMALLDLGQTDAALPELRRAVALREGDGAFLAGLAECLSCLEFEAVSDEFLDDLRRLLEHPQVPVLVMDETILRALRRSPRTASLFDRAPSPAEAAAMVQAVPLLASFLERCVVADPGLERSLTALRRSLLLDGGDGLSAVGLALAHQAFLTDHAWFEEDDETAMVEALCRRLNDLEPGRLAVLAAYRPLHALDGAERLLRRSWPEAMRPLLDRQLAAPLAERELRQSIPCLTGVADAVSQAVRGQYEENPYPRWTSFVAGPRPAAATPRPLPARPDVLVAGCGTGLQALGAAADHPGGRVLAIDLSLSSLAYALRKTREAGVANLDYGQADILELGGLDGRRFDLIECGGVLHHLADPVAGWRVLTGLLKPDGLMKVALYSEIAREVHGQARALIAEAGYAADPAGIRRCRRAVMERPQDFAQLLRSRDFYNLSECRDLLFHVQEHRFTTLGIGAALERLGLAFLGFTDLPRGVAEAFRRRFPDPGAELSLSCWDAFERDNPQTFRRMYVFWVGHRTG